MELTAKVVVLIGGGGGIGAAGARALAAAGAHVVVGDIDEGAARAVAAQITAAGGRAVGARCDAADLGDLRLLDALAVAEFGRVDIVWAHAGKALAGALEQIELADWERLIDLNCLGAVRAFSVFGPRLIEQGSGHLVLTTSSLAFFPEQLPEAAPYVLTKSAILGLGRALRAYLAPRGVGVTLLSPDATLTPHATELPLIGLDDAAFRAQLDPAAMDTPETVAAALVEGIRADSALVALAPDFTDRLRESEQEFLGVPPAARTVMLAGWLEVGAEMHDRLAAALSAVARPTRDEPGNLAYGWSADLDRRGVFHLFEEWATAADLERHTTSAHSLAFLDELRALGSRSTGLRLFEGGPSTPVDLPD